MSRNQPPHASRNSAGRAAKTSAVLRPTKRIGRQSLIERRDLCMAEIARRNGETGDARNLSTKARQLLTRHWWSSSWRARADVLRAAEWLLGIGRSGSPRPKAADARNPQRATPPAAASLDARTGK
jgi:hypothetical protein